MEFQSHPHANEKAIVQWGSYRFTVLTSRCIRIEYSQNQEFVDLATLAIINRDLPVPKYESSETDVALTIKTDHITLVASSKNEAPNEENLLIDGAEFNWRFGQLPKEELWGTTRTLDATDGAIKLGRGLCSRDGFSFIDDTKSPLILDNGLFEPNKSQCDTYFFGYGCDYKECVNDFLKLSGKNPVLPRYAYGLWWSRYWPYTSDEMLAVADDFANHGLPLSVYVIDMDWHITQTGNESSGWTGYTWNRDLIPDPQKLLDELHKRGLAVTMNLHPADGIWPHEEQYKEMAKRMGVEEPNPVKFCGSDPKFMKNYFEVLHHPMEKMGVDFWWIDWQQHNDEKVDPLITLNHQHFLDNGRNKRPIILSRWCGLGGQRYPIGFSGDTKVEWEALQFQPYFSSTAANVGFMYWSHDIGGHYAGNENRELYLRWVQAGALLPIMRMHSNRNPFHERLPWGFDPTIEKLATEAMKFHVAMSPIFYSLSFTDLIVRPMYYEYPKDDSAYACPSQYMIGNDIIAAPFTSPIDPDLGQAFEAVWIPDGIWFDFSSGRQYAKGWYMIYGDLDKIPIFVKGGGVFTTLVDKNLTIDAFPCGMSSFTVIDDDGVSLSTDCCKTEISTKISEKNFSVTVAPTGNQKFIEGRTYTIKFRNIVEDEVEAQGCTVVSKKLVSNVLIVDVKAEQYPFTVSANNKVYQYIKPTESDIFKFIKCAKLNTWVKQVYFGAIKKVGLMPINDAIDISEKLRMHLAFYILGIGYYRFPANTGVDSFVIFNTSGVPFFTYTHVQTSNGIPSKVEGQVPPVRLFKPSEEKSVFNESINFNINSSLLLLRLDSISVTIDFNKI
jgi:hypothetical protein